VNSSHSLQEMKHAIQRETVNQASPFLKMQGLLRSSR